MSTPSPRLLHDAVVTRLDGLAHATVYDGEVAVRPPVIPDGSARVAPYVVVYAGGGRAHHGRRLVVQPSLLAWEVQVTCVGGYQPDCLQLFDDVRTLLTGWAPSAAGALPGRLLEVLSGPRPFRDDDVDPPRWVVTPIWRLTAANA